jgi:hypothetical protein
MARQVKAGAIDQSVRIRILDSTGNPITTVVAGAALTLEYERHLSASVVITDTALASLTTAHTDNGFLHVGNGYYRLDLPDAACAVGSPFVLIHGSSTGNVVIGELIELVAYDPYDQIRMGLLTLPNAAAEAAGGMYTRGTGAGQINQPANGRVDTNVVALASGVIAAATFAVNALDAVWSTATRLLTAGTNIVLAKGTGVTGFNDLSAAQVNTEADTALVDVNLDHLVGTATGIPAAPPADTFLAKLMDNGTIAYNRTIHSLQAAVDNSADLSEFGILVSTTIAVVNSQTSFTLTAGSSINNSYYNQAVAMYDVSNGLYPSVRRVINYVGSTRTITLDSAPDFTIAATDEVRVFVSPASPPFTASELIDNLVGPLATVVANGANTATTFQIDIASVAEGAANWWNDAWLSFDLTSALAGQVKKITAFNQTTGFVTVAAPYTATPTTGHTARVVTR